VIPKTTGVRQRPHKTPVKEPTFKFTYPEYTPLKSSEKPKMERRKNFRT
jgi:hypothetical protein